MGDNLESNQRVTNALILNKLETLSAKLDLYMLQANAKHADHESRIRDIESVQRAIADVADHELRLRLVEKTQEQIKERLGIYAGAQALLTIVGSTIAGWIGARN